MPLRTLSSLKSWQLKQICFLMGGPVTGTKTALEANIRRCIQKPLLPKNGGRILSIDMGIRNLAYTVLDVSNEGSFLTQGLKIQKWHKLDVLDRTQGLLPSEVLSDLTKQTTPKSEVIGKLVANAAFTPSCLSRTAYDLALELLAHRPNTILVERQRFRSAGGANIQEWTVRVNMLEGMLWACLETLKQSQKHNMPAFPQMYEVSPKRVAPFWEHVDQTLPHSDLLSLGKTTGPCLSSQPTKIDKKRRMQYLRDMLNGTEADKITLDFANDEVRVVADSMTHMRKTSMDQSSRRKRLKGMEGIASPEKLDDLTDCMLQGITWVRWEENRRLIANMVEAFESLQNMKKADIG
ncbi:ribonuclease H-like protein [Polychaeton citri CBS 116435]|uniref:Ribonuclease H-like protein n=1 Tax=Polychaeton citri CBS 116435 TaxID=1314669 RepID=A0A9P4Q9C8_9PEZI|nr:ribonuclease H-like protein [Polychaeton citri CBS 116435]